MTELNNNLSRMALSSNSDKRLSNFYDIIINETVLKYFGNIKLSCSGGKKMLNKGVWWGIIFYSIIYSFSSFLMV